MVARSLLKNTPDAEAGVPPGLKSPIWLYIGRGGGLADRVKYPFGLPDQTGSMMTRLPWARSFSARSGTMVARGSTPRCLKLMCRVAGLRLPPMMK